MLALLAALAMGGQSVPAERWFYVQTNLLVEQNVADLLALLDRAKRSGYNGMAVTDSKFSRLSEMGPEYYSRAGRVRDRARELGIAVYPVAAPVGWAEGLLSHDVNLIEGQPVKNALFEVRGGVGRPVREIALPNGGFERHEGDRFLGVGFQDGPGQSSFADTATVKEGKVSVRLQDFKKGNEAGNGRVVQPLKLRPWQQYRITGWIKTENLDGAGGVRCSVIDPKGRMLHWMDLGAQRTEDWRRFTVVFNSQENTEANLYTGIWSGAGGKLWFDGLTIEEAGLLNVLRRPGTPLSVVGPDGRRLEEGRDFETVRDPRLGQTPWPGAYTFDHEAPLLRVPAGSRIKEGDRLQVSYSHAATTDVGKAAICPAEPKTRQLLEDEIKRLVELWRPAGIFLGHDEIRVAHWCEACRTAGASPGQVWAANLRFCVDTAKRLLPGKPVWVWSDMFDPYHNAVDDYYLSAGTWKESWKAVGPDVGIMNWNWDKRAESFAFFASLGAPQMAAGYYDGSVESVREYLKLGRATRNFRGVMFTTWTNDYRNLEAFARQWQR